MKIYSVDCAEKLSFYILYKRTTFEPCLEQLLLEGLLYIRKQDMLSITFGPL